MTRKRFQWKIRDRQLVVGERTLVMGVLNVTPDSFSDGGNYADPDSAFARAMELEDQGADIIDVGAESTRPGSTRISEAEELRRLVPVLKRLNGKLNVPVSVDTYKAAVAAKAIEHGAVIINDPSGLSWDADLAKVVAQHDAGLVVNHMRGTPETWAKLGPLRDLMATIRAELEASVNRARHAGVQKERIVIDPGIGFGKRKEQNSEIIAALDQLRTLLVPILVGPSRKSFLAQQDARETEFATAAAVTAAILNGADIIRVHDVAAMRSVVQVADDIVTAIPEPAEERPRPPRPVHEAPPREHRPPPPRREDRPPAQNRARQQAETERPRRDDRPPPQNRARQQAETERPRRDDRPPPQNRARKQAETERPRRDDRPPPQNRARKQAEAPPRRDDRPPSREFRPPARDRDDRPPRRDFRPGQRDNRPQRPDFKPRGPARGPGRGPKPGGRPGGRPPKRGPSGPKGR